MQLRQLLIKCPTTHRLIFTGVATDQSGYDAGSFTNNSTVCPHCGQTHVWSKENTLLEGDPEAVRRN